MNPALSRIIADEKSRLQRTDSWRSLRAISSRSGASVVFDGRKCVNLSSNDYLGIGSDASLLAAFLLEAGADSIAGRGMGGSSARLLSGNHQSYNLLERELADLYGNRTALVFNSGYHANLGVCASLADRNDVFLADKLCHASLIDGMRLSGAELIRYRHLDTDHLDSLLKKHRASYRNAFIVTESVFSMDGDIPDLQRIARLKRDNDATLVLDEAHAVGVFGAKGTGIASERDLLGDIDVLVGTFGKALGSYGAFVVCDEPVRDFLINKARSFIFTTALPPAVVNWSRTALAKAVGMDHERGHLAQLSGKFREALRAAGAQTGGETQIVPVHIGDSGRAIAVARHLQEAGYLVLPIRPPTVPPGTARLRLSLTANMTWEQIEGLPELIRRQTGGRQ